jgi:hypothetical protein
LFFESFRGEGIYETLRWGRGKGLIWAKNLKTGQTERWKSGKEIGKKRKDLGETENKKGGKKTAG